ncbi:hypothetical protein OG393_32470 [Streptomyces sp. NBC_01216]|uniref:hypothetical protein n=1 Tax=Streptomyces sp. NBC_01216 TaxID=2903778 RepID=UPI002E126D06|nr:hypothetical protein OG393_32470 [Streptomyces sp. NBC_01216]
MTENAGVSYEDCSIYVDAADSSTVIAWLKERLGPEEEGHGLVVGPLRVSSVCNDYSTGRKAHPFEFLEWSTVLECEAPAGVESGAVVAAVTDVLETLRRGGWKAVAACDCEDELPAHGGRDRYPLPSPSGSLSHTRTGRWRSLLVRGGKRKRKSV